MRRILAILFLTLCCLFQNAANAAEDSRPTIRFGIFYFYPPFIYSTSVGFGVNLAQALCQQMQAKCEFVNYTPAEIFTALDEGKIDAIVSALSITAERQKHYLFSNPYYSSTMSFLTQYENDSNPSFDDLAKKKIGVLHNAIFYQFLLDAFPNHKNIKTYPRNSELLLALLDHKVDYIVMDTPVAEYWQRRTKCKLFTVGKPVNIPGDQGFGIVIRQGNYDLQHKINGALDEIKANGKYQQIVSLYFGKTDTPDCSVQKAASQSGGTMVKIKDFLNTLT